MVDHYYWSSDSLMWTTLLMAAFMICFGHFDNYFDFLEQQNQTNITFEAAILLYVVSVF